MIWQHFRKARKKNADGVILHRAVGLGLTFLINPAAKPSAQQVAYAWVVYYFRTNLVVFCCGPHRKWVELCKQAPAFVRAYFHGRITTCMQLSNAIDRAVAILDCQKCCLAQRSQLVYWLRAL